MCLVMSSVTFLFFFFFKQKTAYEILRSDWSSDVCSSDLAAHRRGRCARASGLGSGAALRGAVAFGAGDGAAGRGRDLALPRGDGAAALRVEHGATGAAGGARHNSDRRRV